MPHLTLEYSSNLAGFDAGLTLAALNRTLAATGQFEEIDIKSRALAFDHFSIGTASQDRAFAHVKLAILSGRSAETKLALSEALLHVLQSCCPPAPEGLHVQLCAEILEIDRASYTKAVVTA